MNAINKLPAKFQERKQLIRKIKDQIRKIQTGPKAHSKANEKIRSLLEERVKLIQLCRELNQSRIKNIERLFRHYCTNVFKTGKNYNFDAIGYANEHLIIERFFVMINDFQLNEITINEESKPLISDRNQIILIFKQCSSDARHLELSEFITCLERVFVLLFDANKNYDANQKRLKEERRKLKLDLKEREKKRKQNLKAKKEAILLGQDVMLKTQINSQEKKEQKSIKKGDQLKDIKGGEQLQDMKNGQISNDDMVKQMMKDFEIVNPTDQVGKAVKELHTTQQQQKSDLTMATSEEKIQSYMQKINIDNIKQMLKKVRNFQKANFKYTEVQQLQKYKDVKKKTPQKMLGNSSSIIKKDKQLVLIHEQWKGDKKQIEQSRIQKFLNLSKKLQERQLNKSKKHLASSLSKDEYTMKKSKLEQKFVLKQRLHMDPHTLKRLTMKKEEEQRPVQYSLDMIHRSTPNQLPINKINPERYISSDPSDAIFMNEYNDYLSNRVRPRASSGLSPNNSQIIQNVKRRVKEVQNQQSRKMNPNRQTYNMYKHHHYLQKFLQRKW